jgi:hypothetical protein
METTADITLKGMNSHTKIWIAPAFEIISKDIIKAGVTTGVEGSITTITGSKPEHS